MPEELLATHQCGAVLQHPPHESTASKLSACPMHMSPYISVVAGFAQFPHCACNCSSLSDLVGFSHLLYNSVCDHILPMLGQAVCLGLAVSFLHKVLPLFVAFTPPYTLSPLPMWVLRLKVGGKGSHLTVVEISWRAAPEICAAAQAVCPVRPPQRTGDLGCFRLNLSLWCGDSPW